MRFDLLDTHHSDRGEESIVDILIDETNAVVSFYPVDTDARVE